LPGAILVGAHYDHLGLGGSNSLAPDVTAPHLGADDNASGVAAMLEIARMLAANKERRRDVLFTAFSAEESGVLGSSHMVHSPPAGIDIKQIYAMLNLDMVGRLRDNRLTVLGAKTATEWDALTTAACKAERVSCTLSGDGYGPSDQTSFYAAGVPVLHFFSGSHSDYHKPSDSADRINAAGAAQIAGVISLLSSELAKKPEALSFQQLAPEEPRGDMRSFNASLGTIPDYAGPKSGSGVLLSGVHPGGAADKAGFRRGDILVRLGKAKVESVYDLMYVLNSAKPGQTVTATVLREDKPIDLPITFEERAPRKE
jgi:hypothetical protein